MIAHYASTVAYVFAAICGVFLVIIAMAYLDTPRSQRRFLIWEVPATCAGLGVFWAAAAFGLSLL